MASQQQQQQTSPIAPTNGNQGTQRHTGSQRITRPPVVPNTVAGQGSHHSLRDSSRSPSVRQRTIKSNHSMPAVPTSMQVFGNDVVPNDAQQQQQQQQQQTSPILANSLPSVAGAGPGVSVTRLLPTPPHPPPDSAVVPPLPGDRRPSPPPLNGSQHSHSASAIPTTGNGGSPSPHYPRPINRSNGVPQFLTSYEEDDSLSVGLDDSQDQECIQNELDLLDLTSNGDPDESFHMSDVMEDIARADREAREAAANLKIKRDREMQALHGQSSYGSTGSGGSGGYRDREREREQPPQGHSPTHARSSPRASPMHGTTAGANVGVGVGTGSATNSPKDPGSLDLHRRQSQSSTHSNNSPHASHASTGSNPYTSHNPHNPFASRESPTANTRPPLASHPTAINTRDTRDRDLQRGAGAGAASGGDRDKESPKTRTHLPPSPNLVQSFVQARVMSPIERRGSPLAYQVQTANWERERERERESREVRDVRDVRDRERERDEPPKNPRRQSNPLVAASAPGAPAGNTPPLVHVPSRTPDRSLPLQEELDDENVVAATSPPVSAGSRGSAPGVQQGGVQQGGGGQSQVAAQRDMWNKSMVMGGGGVGMQHSNPSLEDLSRKGNRLSGQGQGPPQGKLIDIQSHSPTPSSDLHPEGWNGTRVSATRERDHNREPQDVKRERYPQEERRRVEERERDTRGRVDVDEDEEEEDFDRDFTPRSPTADLPDIPPTHPVHPALFAKRGSPAQGYGGVHAGQYGSGVGANAGRGGQQQGQGTQNATTTRARHGRSGSTDGVGMRTFDPSLFAGDTSELVMGSVGGTPGALLTQQQPRPEQGGGYRNAQKEGAGREREREEVRDVRKGPQVQEREREREIPRQQQEVHQHQVEDQHHTGYDSSYLQSYYNASPHPGTPQVPPAHHHQQQYATQNQRGYDPRQQPPQIQTQTNHHHSNSRESHYPDPRQSQHQRPDAPIPPTPHSATNAPSPLVSAAGGLVINVDNASEASYDLKGSERDFFEGRLLDDGSVYDPRLDSRAGFHPGHPAFMDPRLLATLASAAGYGYGASPGPGMYEGGRQGDNPPFSPVPQMGSPYPYPFSHVRRNPVPQTNRVGIPTLSQGGSGLNPARGNLKAEKEAKGREADKAVAREEPRAADEAKGNGNASISASEAGGQLEREPSTAPITDPQSLRAIQAEIAKQWLAYARNTHDAMSESTFSPASTPFSPLPGQPHNPHGAGYNFDPWAHLHASRYLGLGMGGRVGGGAGALGLAGMSDNMSMRSSPSHEPVALPTPPPTLGLRKRGTGANALISNALGAKATGGISSTRPNHTRNMSARKPPPRVQSTQPRETSPEPESSSGEETAGEDNHLGINAGVIAAGVATTPVSTSQNAWEDGSGGSGGGSGGPSSLTAVDDDIGEWVDEEDDEQDLLELEYHPNYVGAIEKRRRRWEIGWEALIQAFQALDRQTDATLVLLASPSHSTKLYTATSRSIRRQNQQQHKAGTSSQLHNIYSSFNRLASHRRTTRSQNKSTLLSRFLYSAATGGPGSGEGSDGSDSREEELRRALDTALGSLGALSHLYDQREMRWAEELRRMNEERERVTLLMKQVLGEGSGSSLLSAAGTGASASTSGVSPVSTGTERSA